MKFFYRIEKLLLACSIGVSLSCWATGLKAEQQGYVQVKAGKLYYRIFGSAGTPVIVLHGGPGLDQGYLLPQMLALAEKNKVVFYDQRGSGKSLETPINEQTINIEQFTYDLEKLRRHLGYKKFTLMGHSWGGMLAIKYAIQYPNNLSALVLLNSIPATSAGVNAFIDEYNKRTAPIKSKLDAIQKSPNFIEGEPEKVSEFYRTMFSVYFYKQEQVRELSLNFTSDSALNGFKIGDIYEKTLFSKSYDWRPLLGRLVMRTLIIHGESDPIPAWTAEEIKAAIPNARLVMLKKCGHFPYIEQPKEFFGVLGNFLAGVAQ
jgi:proline iminopeptidase